MGNRTMSAVFDRYEDAAEAVRQLEAAGVPHEDISIVSGDASRARLHALSPTEPPEEPALSGTGAGASLGTLLGGGAGLLAGLGLIAIPGVGAAVGAGWLAATLVGAGVGAAAGGVVGSLTEAGFSETDAETYADGLDRGGTLVTARAAGMMIEPIAAILDRSGAIDLAVQAPLLTEGVTTEAVRSTAPEIPPVGDPALAEAGLVPRPEPEADDMRPSGAPRRAGIGADPTP